MGLRNAATLSSAMLLSIIASHESSALAQTQSLAPAASRHGHAIGQEAGDAGFRDVVTMTQGWRFTRGNPPLAASLGFDDSHWQSVRVPHDWAISTPFDPKGDSNSRFNWHGDGWYRHTFEIAAKDAGKRVYFDFDGVMAFPKVYVNGKLAGQWDYGYNSFRVDATDFVNVGQPNVIAVYVDTRDHGSRWYPGAGIYRKVTMAMTDPVHVAHWGSFVTTPSVSRAAADVRIETTVENHSSSAEPVTLTTSVYAPDHDDQPILQQATTVTLPAGGHRPVAQIFDVRNPVRWDTDAPKLYRAVTVVRVGGQERDRYATNFGIRTSSFTSTDGYYLNGRRVDLKGVTLHHDQGPLGAAFHVRAMERQLEILKSMGVNAIRTSHNPPAPELLELTDRMGLIVFAEAFDKWDATADILGGVDLGQFGERQIRNFIQRDRNHPSVMIWSIGNEMKDIENNVDGNSVAKVAMMAGFVHKYDSTRPVTMASHIPSSLYTGIYANIDVQSWNYGWKYIEAKKVYPDVPMLASETSSAVSTRDDYELPLPKYKEQWPWTTSQVSSYDLNAVPWGDVPDVEFQGLENNRFAAGEFVWSGFDYIGEPTPYEGTARSSYFGIVDLVGLPKDRYYLYRSHWAPTVNTVHILPHWTWTAGTQVPVYVYTNGDSAELFLNGRSLGKRTKLDPKAPTPHSFAQSMPANVSSEETKRHNLAMNANDGDPNTRWCAEDGSPNAFWQVDLGQMQSLRSIHIQFEQAANNYQYVIKGSADGTQWRTLATKADDSGDDENVTHGIDATSRFLRIEFTALKPGAWASIREFEAFPVLRDFSYYGVTDRYRLRWDNVAYEPGELRAVAYAGGRRVGEDVVRTAGKATRLVVAADRTTIHADGDDLSYITVGAQDGRGTTDVNAADVVHFEVDGPGELVGVGNGDPTSTDPFVANFARLFHGKTVAIIRSKPNMAGAIRLTARSNGMAEAAAVVTTVNP